jgi:hypothetical protein
MENTKPIMDMDDELEQLAKEVARMREIVQELHVNIIEVIRQRDEAVEKLNKFLETQTAQ